MTVASHPSSSEVQRKAEEAIVDAFSRKHGVLFSPGARRVELDAGSKTRVEVDATTADHSIVIEAYARQGKLKGAQIKKIAQDILKLALVKRILTGQKVDAYIVFASDEARASISGWLLLAADSYGVNLVTVDIDDALRDEILHAQDRQIMVNAAPLADDVETAE